jgi:hypothetical protein
VLDAHGIDGDPRSRATMKITQSQLAFFQARAEESFVERVVAHLLDHHAALVAGFSSDELEDRVKDAIARGRGHGFTWESSLAWFVVSTFLLGPGFEENPAIEATSQIEDEEERIQVILEGEEA